MLNRVILHATACLLGCALLAACSGGKEGAPFETPLVTAARSEAEPMGQLASVKASALKAEAAHSPAVVDASALFDWAEIQFPELFAAGPANQVVGPYTFRFYPTTGLYLAVQDDLVLALGPATANQVIMLGHLKDFTCSVFPEVCQPPVAVVGPNQSVKVGDSIVLDGSLSHDPSGDALSFKWAFVERPAGSLTALNSSTAAQPSFTADLPGLYTLQLVVNDGRSDSVPVSVNVTASHANSAPIAVAGSNRSVATGLTVNLDGSASSDADHDALTYKWSLVSKPANSAAILAESNTPQPSFVAAVSGSYQVSLIVNDGKVDSPPSMVTITAVVANVAPVAVPGGSQSVSTGAFVYLSGAGSFDANGDPITFQWTLVSRPAGSTAALTLSTASSLYFLADVAGNYVFSLAVSDGKLSSSGSLTVTAVGTTTPPPSRCCRVCSTGKPCGDSCISRTSTCRVGGGCAC